MYTPLTHHPPSNLRVPIPPQASRSSPQLRSSHYTTTTSLASTTSSAGLSVSTLPRRRVLSTGSGSIAPLPRISISSGAPSEIGSHLPRINGAEARSWSGTGFGTGKERIHGNSALGAMNDLKKQNFDLKLALFHYEEATSLSNQRGSEEEVTRFKRLLETAESKLLAAYDHISALEDAFRRLSGRGQVPSRVVSVGTQTHPVIIREVEGTFEQDRRMYEVSEAENRKREIEAVDVETLEDQVRWLEEERESPLVFRDAGPGLEREREYFGGSEEGEVGSNEAEAQKQVKVLAAMDQAGLERCLTGMEFDEAIKGEKEEPMGTERENEKLVQMNTTLGGRYFVEHLNELPVTPNGENLHAGNLEEAQDHLQESHFHANGQPNLKPIARWRDAATTTDDDTSTEEEQTAVARVVWIESKSAGGDGRNIGDSKQQSVWRDEKIVRPLRYRIEWRTAANVVPSVARRQGSHEDILKGGEYQAETKTPDATLDFLDPDMAIANFRHEREGLRDRQIRRLYGQEVDPASAAELSQLISPPISIDDGGSVCLSTLGEGTTVDLDGPFDIADPIPSGGKGGEAIDMLEELEGQAGGHDELVWALPGVGAISNVIPQVPLIGSDDSSETIVDTAFSLQPLLQSQSLAEDSDSSVSPQMNLLQMSRGSCDSSEQAAESSSPESISTILPPTATATTAITTTTSIPRDDQSLPLLSSSISPSSSSSTSFSPRQSRRSKLPRPVSVRPAPSVTSSSSSSSTVLMFVDHPQVGTTSSPIVRSAEGSERAWSAGGSTNASRSTSPKSPVAEVRRGNSLGGMPSQLQRDGDHASRGRVKKDGSLKVARNGRWAEEKIPTGARVGATTRQGRGMMVGEEMGR
ncbi:hypothetical protein BC937DRAFT_90474 [Endogone sp. FLAS-F59071]|nr:hypothetical protein BC937DRAFT_90474 [Endogone sp. FLAS-F59071]|eukprot:RUS17058.1 hypothetical protein BC937DRAFT_90474 [Endogone sp. FLAS-F59071]